MKCAAAGRFRGSVAHPAAHLEPDTIPMPDGLAMAFHGAAPTPKIRGERGRYGLRPRVGKGAASSQARSYGGPASDWN